MIRASHAANEYARPSFSEPPAEIRFRQVLARLLSVAGKGPDDLLALGDSGEPTVEEFARRFEDVRDVLVERRLRGERLSGEEDLVLELINAALWSTMVEPKAESDRVRLAVEEGERLLRSLANAQD
jgi:hypothetical protein